MFETRSSLKVTFVLAGAFTATIVCFYIMMLLISNELTREAEFDETTYVAPSFREAQPDLPEPARKKPAKLLPLTPPDDPEGAPMEKSVPTEFIAKRPVLGSIADVIGPEDIKLELSAPHSDLVPLSIVQPIYPLSAARREIEGYVVVKFTVRENGTVVNPIVVDSQPEILFDQAALSAVSRFRFKPREVGGDQVRVDDVQLKFAFNLESLYEVEENQ